jgi:YggT family protein
MTVFVYYLMHVIVQVVNVYVLVVIVWAIFSWFDHSRGVLDDIYRVLNTLVEPVMRPFRRFIPPIGGIDITPLIVILGLQLVVRLLQQIVFGII